MDIMGFGETFLAIVTGLGLSMAWGLRLFTPPACRQHRRPNGKFRTSRRPPMAGRMARADRLQRRNAVRNHRLLLSRDRSYRGYGRCAVSSRRGNGSLGLNDHRHQPPSCNGASPPSLAVARQDWSTAEVPS